MDDHYDDHTAVWDGEDIVSSEEPLVLRIKHRFHLQKHKNGALVGNKPAKAQPGQWSLSHKIKEADVKPVIFAAKVICFS